ncbi:MAG: GntR family transcriptional regulator [Fimbriimonadaceae bacterium]
MPNNKPLYQQVLEALERAIEVGEWKVGERLPGELQLAERFGVSYMTVRHAIQHLDSSGLVRRIRGKGVFVADPPEDRRTEPLALLLPQEWYSMDPFYFPLIVKGFQAEATLLGRRTVLADQSDRPNRYAGLISQKVAAVACVLLGQPDVQGMHQLLDQGVPVVAINKHPGARRIPTVAPDNFGGSYRATRYLIELGHRDLLFLAGPRDSIDAQERRKGFQEAVRRHGAAGVRHRILEGGFLEESGLERGRLLARRAQAPTAVVSASDVSAIGFIRALAEAGLRVPSDVSVFGFGDFRISPYLVPSLSTVRIDLEQLGRRAVQLMRALLERTQPESVTIDCPLILRESIGPPRRQGA